MSRNFELLQNIGKEQEYFQRERPLRERVPVPVAEPQPEPMAEQDLVGQDQVEQDQDIVGQDQEPVLSATDLAPAPVPVPNAAPLQFDLEGSQLAELAKLVQRVFLLPGSEYNHRVVFTSSDA